MRFLLPLALAVCTAAQAQITVDQFYNFNNTVLTTDALGRWNVPMQGPPSGGGSVHGQYFVTFVDYNLVASSQVSFNFVNTTGSAGSLSYDPRGDLGPVKSGGPNPVIGTLGQQVQVPSVANGSTTPVSYVQNNFAFGTAFNAPAYNLNDPVSYNVFMVQPLATGNPIRFTSNAGAVSTYAKTDTRVTNYSESCMVSGTILVRYTFSPGQYSVICNGQAPLGLYGDQSTTRSVLGLTGMPPSAPAVCVYGASSIPINALGLCIGGPQRMNGTNTLSDTTGTLIRKLDGNGVFVPLNTYYFQTWFRSSSGGVPIAVFSDAIRATLQ